MKRLVFAALLVLAMFASTAQTVVYVNSAVVEWDAVTTAVDGSPVPASEISYQAVIAKPADKNNFTILGETQAVVFTVTLPSEGTWVVGVRAIRTVGTDRIMSAFLWSDETTDPFVLLYLKAPAVPENLRVQ